MLDPTRATVNRNEADLKTPPARQFSCPPAGNSMAVYGQDLMAADKERARRHRRLSFLTLKCHRHQHFSESPRAESNR